MSAPHAIRNVSFDGTGAVCGVCGKRVLKGLSGKGLRHETPPPHQPYSVGQ